MSNSSHLIVKDQVSSVTESPIVLKLRTKSDVEATRAAVRMFSSKVDDTFFGKKSR